MKRIVKLLAALVVLYLLLRLCTSQMGSVITLPGGMGGSSSEDSGGWFSPKDNGGDKTLKDISAELEKELGIGKDKEATTTENVPSTTPSTTSSSPSPSREFPSRARFRRSETNW